MPQAATSKAKSTTKVQKALKDECYRKSVESSWQRSKAATDSLEVLARCKALNEFIKKGLLAEVDDDTAAAGQAKPGGAQKHHLGNTTANNASQTKGKPLSPSPAPLTTRITAKESEALLQLLQLDDVTGVAAPAPSPPAAGGGSGTVDASDAPASSLLEQPDSGRPDSNRTTTAAANPASVPLEPAQLGTGVLCNLVPVATSSNDMLDDVIGLLNASDGVMITACDASCSISDQLHQQPQTPPSAQQHALMQYEQEQQPAGAVSLPQAACREVHRQAWVRPAEQQQLDLQAAANKHASISAAWQGFYSYWGPHAASTMQHYWRAHRARQRYLQLREAAVVLQACTRGHLMRVSQANLLRVHREQQLQQLLLQQQQQRQQEAEQQLLQQQEQAAVVLQSAVRGRAARCQHRVQLAAAVNAQQTVTTATAAAAASSNVTSPAGTASLAARPNESVAAAAVAGVGDEAVRCISSAPSVCSRGSDSSCSRGSSRQSHSRGSTVCSFDVSPAAAAATTSTSAAAAEVQGDVGYIHPPQPVADVLHQAASYQEAVSVQYELPGLLIRSAAEMRSAVHSGATAAGVKCREDLARQLVQRAGQLGVCEGQRSADLATRAVMASSSFRQLPAAMGAVRTARTTT